MISTKWKMVLLLLALAYSPAASRSQDVKVYKKIPAERVEEILKGMTIDFQKKPSPTDKKLVFFTYEHNKYQLALHDYDGVDLMLVARFPALPVSAINQWNRGAKISRAVFYQHKLEDYSALEANLDVSGGVTDDTIRHFIRRFEEEVKKFDQFMFPAAVREEEVFTKVSAERLEKILKDMNIKFKKAPSKVADIATYEFERDVFKIRLHSFKGEDLMLDAVFKEIPLTEINKYNLGRKFIRVVQYQPDNGKKHTVLEANLDCTGGVSDRIIRYFIGTFDGEVQEFARFTAK